ncbi:helix-turn-helix domain-containing protein [uncultured Roseibium sp.]|uniref:helix-turn-helix transcriptional regulator n=1 Tax=uncultured Roseibium sp. TaxID=1936171 RepID=UPI00321711C6
MSDNLKPLHPGSIIDKSVSASGTDTSEWIVARPLSVAVGIAKARGRDWIGILEKYGLGPDDLEDQDRKINVHDVIAVFEDVAKAIGDDAVILNEFSALPVGYAYTFDYVGLLADSLHDSLQNWQRFYPLHSNALVLNYSKTGGYGVLECHLPETTGPAVQAAYAFVAWISGRIELVIGTVEENILLEFAAPPPRQTCPFLEKHSSRVRFGQTANRVLIPAQLLETRPPQADKDLLKIVEDAAEQDMRDLMRTVSPFSELTETVEACLKSGDGSMGKVAATMGVSPRALQRALEGEGTCFRNILEEVRSSMARRYLTETELPMKEIAYLLSFSETSALSRAVKRWFGQSPRAIREREAEHTSEF